MSPKKTKLLVNRGPEWQRQFIENYWLNLGDVSELRVVNPFSNRTQHDIENPHLFLLSLMRRPEYFYFTCKYIFNKTLPPLQLAVLRELWSRPFPMLIGSRGMGKSFILALYAMLRALFCQGSKIVIVGSAFRQAKVVFDYCQYEIWDKAPVLRDLVGDDRRNGPRRDVDRCTLRIGDSLIVALPLGDGTKIRGQRANIIIADEFASIPVPIFETVVKGFGAVASDPIDKLRLESRIEAMKILGLFSQEKHEEQFGNILMSNQTIVSGTAYYAFNHFYEYWKRYKSIIESKGDPGKLAEIFQGRKLDPDFNWKDFSIIRIPWDKLPKGFMDQKTISLARATTHIGIYQMEYGAVFATDSNGFYKRSLIESCVVGKPAQPISLPSCGTVNFAAALRGNPNSHYVMGVDPASEQDNFSVVVLECCPDHRRIVHCWTTTRSRYKAKQQKGLVHETDFYGYAARKIRDLLRYFPCQRIAIDTQGGGIAVIEALQDRSKFGEGERAILPVVVEDEPKDTDNMPGHHILELVNFAKADWVSEANHGMRKDFEDKALLFPHYDAAAIGLAIEEDKESGRVKVDLDGSEKLYDTLEDCMLEIEDLKDELATIVHSQTGTSGRDRWDTPEIKQAGGKRGRLRKDRYSSLLMANMVGRILERTPKTQEYQPVGGFAHQIAKDNKARATGGQMWIGPAWWTEPASGMGNYGAVVKRRR